MNIQEKKRAIRSEKTLLFVSFLSICMIFAGLTSGYVVRSGYKDWKFVDLPSDFTWSTLVIVLSSLVAQWGYMEVKNNRYKQGGSYILMAAVLGAIFGYLQYNAFFKTLVNEGYFVTGDGSQVSISYLFVIVLIHFLHIVGGLITLVYMGIKALRHGYNKENIYRLNIGLMFWHFLGFLWLYLFLFLHFFR